MSTPQVNETVEGPLSGIRVLDLGRFIAAPYCAMMLGDLGADVVKLERRRGGDNARTDKPQFAPDESFYFLVFNRNKRSVTIDFRSQEGQKVLRDLATESDVLIENFRVGTMEKMGCGWDDLAVLNPRLIMARVSGFGQDGPYADQICTDTIAQAMGGLMEITGDPDGPPVMCGTYVVDYVTALYATIGILGALQHRVATGKGQLVDVALLDSAVSLLLTGIVEYGLTGSAMTRMGNHDRFAAPSDVFRTSDGGWVYLVVGASHFGRLATAIGQTDLISDERYATFEDRLEHRFQLNQIVTDWVGAHTTREVVAIMKEANVLCSQVAGMKEIWENPQLRHRGQIVDISHPILGQFPMQGPTVKLAASPASIRRSPPLLGAHTVEVLAEWLEYDEGRLETLRRNQVI